MITYKQIAERLTKELGYKVSKQAVYKRAVGRLKDKTAPKIHTEHSKTAYKTTYTDDVISIFIEDFKTHPLQALDTNNGAEYSNIETAPNSHTEHSETAPNLHTEHSNSVLDILQEQLQVKDKQIQELQEQIKTLTKLLEHEQELRQGNLLLQIEEAKEEQPKKKTLFDFFKRK